LNFANIIKAQAGGVEMAPFLQLIWCTKTSLFFTVCVHIELYAITCYFLQHQAHTGNFHSFSE